MINFNFLTKIENLYQGFSLSYQRRNFVLLILAFFFLLAGMIRLYKLSAPGLVLEREYRSALIARAYYFVANDSIPDWRRQVAVSSKQRAGVLEPPIMELVVSYIYRLINGEHLWVARLLASSFWLIGGFFLYALTRIVESDEAALFSTAYYLLVPLGVLASRSLQPDSLMIMMFLVSLFAIVMYYEKPSTVRLVISASVSGLAMFIRPLVLFTIFSVFISLAVYKKGILKGIVNRDLLTFAGVSLLPPALFYGYGVIIAGFLRWKVETSFLPHLFLTREYWKGWLVVGSNAVGFAPLVAALIGVPSLRKGLPRALLIGLGIGYIIFCLVFNFHIHFADYYHLQLIPIIAIPLGSLVALIMNHLKMLENRWYWWTPLAGALILVVVFYVRDVRGKVGSQVVESKAVAQEVGEIVGHSTRTVYVSTYYGMPLEYFGELSGAFWPRKITYWLYRLPGERELSIEQRINNLGFSPEYFVITDFKEFNLHHSDLKDYLANKCSLVAESEKYLIYNNCTS